MLVNCENSSTLRPSASSSSSISIRLSSLPELLPRGERVPLSSISRVSQQTWRSFSSASRITIWLRARPLRPISSRTLLSMARRTVS
ncbi:hypothetical protein D3C81_2160890 [compost metagenome]